MNNNDSTLFRLLSGSTPVPQEGFERLQQSAEFITLKANTSLIETNTRSRYIYLVKNGLLRARFITEEGKEFSKEFYWEGDIIFGMRSLLDNKPLPYSVRSEETCELVQIPVQIYQQLVEDFSSWKNYHIHQLERHLLYKEIKEELLLLHSNEQKVLKVYQLFPALVNRVPATLIASYLGLTPVSLSRIKKRAGLS